MDAIATRKDVAMMIPMVNSTVAGANKVTKTAAMNLILTTKAAKLGLKVITKIMGSEPLCLGGGQAAHKAGVDIEH